MLRTCSRYSPERRGRHHHAAEARGTISSGTDKVAGESARTLSVSILRRVHVVRDDMKRVLPGGKVGVVRDAALSGRGPVALESLHPVSEPQPLRRREPQRRVLNLELAFARRKVESGRKRNRRTTRDRLLDDDRQAAWTLRFVGDDDDGAFRARQPDLAGRRDDARRLDAASHLIRVETFGGVIQPHGHVPGRMRRARFEIAPRDRDDAARAAQPEIANAVFADEVNLVARQSVLRRELRQPSRLQQEQPGALRADPESPFGILVERPHFRAAQPFEQRIVNERARSKPRQSSLGRHPDAVVAIQQQGRGCCRRADPSRR